MQIGVKGVCSVRGIDGQTDRNLEIFALWKEGDTYSKIGKLYGLSGCRVQQIVTTMLQNGL